MNRNPLLGALAALAVLLALPLAAQAQYPNKPVKLMVGYAAGSSTDIIGRIMAERLSVFWKQNVYVESRGGAAGNLAADAVAKAPGDGYTLLFAQNGLAISAAAIPNLPFKAETDLLPLVPATATPHILIVAPESGIKNVQELVSRAKAEPGKLAYGSSGIGNSDHLCGELFSLLAGIQAIHVPYKGGAPAATDLMGGRIAYYFAGMPVGLPLAKSGRARGIAVTSKARFPGAPDIPTVAEQGLPDYEATLWQGFFAPASLPAELAEKISRDVRTVLAQPETRDKLTAAGVALYDDSHANFRKFFVTEIDKWRGVVRKSNLKLE
jgi:tripartite-type tricarboxylate transporter receptor subunit TctC